MLEDLIPRSAGRFRCLPLLGPSAEDFATWLTARGYRKITVANKIWPLPQIDRWLRAHRVAQLTAIDPIILAQCREAFRRKSQTAAAVWSLGQYLTAQGLMRPRRPEPLTPRTQLVAEYAHHLESARGLAPATIARHTFSATRRGRPLRANVFRLAIVLLYTMGLRRRELVRLQVRDYDPQQRTLLIRSSKFHKTRLLPMADDGVREMEQYLATRRAYRPDATAEDAPLLWNGSAVLRSCTGQGFARVFGFLLKTAGIRKPDGRLPRVHDMRHSFAVNALLRWYRSGCDVQAKLPLLATYMGYVSIGSTQYYLPFIKPLATAASERFAQRYGALITPASDRRAS